MTSRRWLWPAGDQRLRHTKQLSLAFVLAALLLEPVVAQLPPAVRSIERPPERPREGLEVEPPPARPSFTLPPLEPPAERDMPRTGPSVIAREFRFTGNTVFSVEQLAEVTQPYLNRTVTAADLEDLRRKLTLYYVERGYITSGVLLPDQRVSDGIIEFAIVEGTLTDIEVDGNEQMNADYIRDRLRLGAGPPVNVNDLQERLQLLLQTPFLDRISAELIPGDRPAEAVLRTRVEEATPYQLTQSINNHFSPSQGDFQSVTTGRLYNLTGDGDVLSAEVALAEGLRDVFLDYVRPINKYDTTVGIAFEIASTDVVEEPFDVVDIESDFWSVGIRLAHPLHRTANEQLWLSAAFDRRHSQTSLLGRGFPFSPGVTDDGRSDVFVARLSGDWTRRTRNQVIAARSTLSLGLDAFNATTNRTGPSAEFAALLLQFQWAHRFEKSGIQALLRADSQLTNHQLLPLEQFAVGGVHSVRGYRENQLVRDWGYAASLELRIPLPILLGRGDQPTMYLAPFVDVGGAWNKGRPTPDPRDIASVGVGLRWNPHRKVHAQLYWGVPLVNVDNPNNNLQDSGIHFSLTANLFD